RWDTYVPLTLDCVGILDVHAVRHPVVGGPDNLGSRRHQPIPRLAQLAIRLADLQPEVVQTNPPSAGDGGRTVTDFDQEQLVVGSAGREGRRRKTQLYPRSLDLPPAEDLAVEPPRALQMATIQH